MDYQKRRKRNNRLYLACWEGGNRENKREIHSTQPLSFALQILNSAGQPTRTRTIGRQGLVQTNHAAKTDFHNHFHDEFGPDISIKKTLLGLGSGLGLGLLTLFFRCWCRFLLRLLLLGSRTALSLVAIRRGPESQVVTEELHDKGAIAVALLGEGVELSNSIIESLLGQVARTIGRVQDLIVEDREVKGQTKADGVGRSEVSLSDIGSVLERFCGQRPIFGRIDRWLRCTICDV